MLTLTDSKIAYMKTTPGERIRQSRKDAKLTQQQVGKAVGVTREAVALWESDNTKSLRPENLFKLARAVKKNAEWLATNEGPEFPADTIADAIYALPVENARQVLNFIQVTLTQATAWIAEEERGRYVVVLNNFQTDLERRSSKVRYQ